MRLSRPAEACEIYITWQNVDAEAVICGHCPPAQPPCGGMRKFILLGTIVKPEPLMRLSRPFPVGDADLASEEFELDAFPIPEEEIGRQTHTHRRRDALDIFA